MKASEVGDSPACHRFISLVRTSDAGIPEPIVPRCSDAQHLGSHRWVAGRAVQTTEKDPYAHSLVVRVLLMGDAGAGGREDPSQAPKPGSIEAQLLAERPAELRADVLVVGHHGSKTGSRKAFVDAVRPGLSVISSGPKKYGSVTLPDAEIVSLLEEHGPVFRTDIDDAGCAKNPEKTGNDADGKPGGCENVVVTVGGEREPRAQYTGGGDTTGVAECDEYIEKYERCITTSPKIPEVAKRSMRASFDMIRVAWKESSATPSGRAGLATGCRRAIEAARQALVGYDCQW